MTWHTVDGVLLSRVAGHRVSEQDDSEGDHVRQQAAKLCDLTVKYNLTQQVGVPTREKEVLFLVWSNDPDLVSNIQVDSFPVFTDHSVVTATTSYRLDKELKKDEQFLLESGFLAFNTNQTAAVRLESIGDTGQGERDCSP